MQIAITDLTRMYDGHVCAAGVDIATRTRIRAVLPDGERLSSRMLATQGGPLDIGNIVDFGTCKPHRIPPEVEDVVFVERDVRLASVMSAGDFLSLLREVAADSLDVIGPALKRDGSSMVTESGTGLCSLVILKAVVKPYIRIYEFDNGRKLRFRSPENNWHSVTDVRLYQDDLATPDEAKLASLQRALNSSDRTYLSFGLTRQDPRRGYRHYLQLNNVHVPQWPDWRLSPES